VEVVVVDVTLEEGGMVELAAETLSVKVVAVASPDIEVLAVLFRPSHCWTVFHPSAKFSIHQSPMGTSA
jgi:hypothetical protein